MLSSKFNVHTVKNNNIIKKANNLFYFCNDIKHFDKNNVVTKNAIRTLNYLDFSNHSYVLSLIKDIEEEFFCNPYDYSCGEDLKILKNFPYSISYIHTIEFLENGHELIHKNTLTEDKTIVIGLNNWKVGSTFRLSLKKQKVKYPFKFEKGSAVIFNSSMAREVLENESLGNRMLVISLVKDPSKSEIIKEKLKKLSLESKEELANNDLNSKGKFSRFWRGLKNGINILR